MGGSERGTSRSEPTAPGRHTPSAGARTWSSVLESLAHIATTADASLEQPGIDQSGPLAACVRQLTGLLRAALQDARQHPLPDAPEQADALDGITQARAASIWPQLVRELDESTRLFRSIVSDDLCASVKAGSRPESLSGYWVVFSEESPLLARRLESRGVDGLMEGGIAAVIVKGRWPSARDMVASLAGHGRLPYVVQVLAHEMGHASLEGLRGRVNRWLLVLLVPTLVATGVLGGWDVLAEACLVSALVARWRSRRAADSAVHESVAHAFESGAFSGQTRGTWHRRLRNHWCVRMHGEQGVADAREAFDLLRTGWMIGIDSMTMVGALRHRPRAEAVESLRTLVLPRKKCQEGTGALLDVARTLEDRLVLVSRCRVMQIVRRALAGTPVIRAAIEISTSTEDSAASGTDSDIRGRMT